MEDIEIVLERHEQRIKTLEREMSMMKEVQTEIRSINETLVTLAIPILILQLMGKCILLRDGSIWLSVAHIA